MLLHDIEITSDRPLLIFPEGECISPRELKAWATCAESEIWISQIRGASVGLCCKDNGLIALMFLLLDGIAARVTLLPSDLAPETLTTLSSGSGVKILVSDRPDAASIGIPLAPLPPPLSAQSSISNKITASSTFNTEWVLPTSGTTRTPKLVAHTVNTLARTVKRDPQKGAGLRWGLLYDLNRFAGLQVYLQALLGGAALILPRFGVSLEDTLAAFTAAGCNALSATPTLWRKILMTPRSKELPLRLITLGGEIADQSILSALAASFPSARVTHIYASTEAGVGFSVTDGLEGFPATFLQGMPNGVNLRISPEGILELRPTVGGQHYLGENSPLAHEDGFVSTGDRVQIKNDRVYFLGRDSGAINVGGNKVQPEKVESILLSHPAVAMASVTAKRSGITGSLVEARLILHPSPTGSNVTAVELREWCTSRLDRFEVPALIRIVADLELNASGKLSRK